MAAWTTRNVAGMEFTAPAFAFQRANTFGTLRIIVMESGGELELEFANEDSFSYHGAYIQNNGGRVMVALPVHERGKAKVRLDGPGMYWFGCPVSNHATRGMLGMILVSGEVPADAKLDRPKQSRDITVPIKSDPSAQSHGHGNH